MPGALKPTTAAEVVEAVAQAVADEAPLEIVGRSTKGSFARGIVPSMQ